jgi:hypothetical protein
MFRLWRGLRVETVRQRQRILDENYGDWLHTRKHDRVRHLVGYLRPSIDSSGFRKRKA